MRKSSILLLIMLSLVLALSGCKTKMKNQVSSSDNVSISYDVQGQGKPALVFVHGWCCDKSHWKSQIPYFAKQHTVVTIDLAGHGDSGSKRKTWTMEAFGKDVATVVKKLDLDKVILIGHSMGGAVIIEAAKLMPDRTIALVGADTFHDLGRSYTNQQIDGYVFPYKLDFEEKTRDYIRSVFHPNSDAELVEQVAADASLADPDIAIVALEQLLRYDFKEALKQVQIPIYCINSDMIPTNVEANRQHAYSFEMKLMTGVGHFVMLEDPNKFNQLLKETIKPFLP